MRVHGEQGSGHGLDAPSARGQPRGTEPGWAIGGRHRLFVRNRWFVSFGYTVGLAGGTPAVGGGVVREAGAAPGQAGRAAPGARRSGGRAGRAAQMELRAARAAARRRVGAYTAIVTAVGFAWLALAGGTPALGRVRQGVGLRAWVSASCWGWRRWSPWSPRPASVWSRSSSCHRGRPPGLPGRDPGRPKTRPGPGRRQRAGLGDAAEQARLVEGEQALIRRSRATGSSRTCWPPSPTS